MQLYCDGQPEFPEFLFCDNETNVRRLWGADAPGQYFKDGINDYVVNGSTNAVNPERRGTKVAAYYRLLLSSGENTRLRARFTPDAHAFDRDDFDRILAERRAEADEFYAALQEDIVDPDARLVQRQALAGMLWFGLRTRATPAPRSDSGPRHRSSASRCCCRDCRPS